MTRTEQVTADDGVRMWASRTGTDGGAGPGARRAHGRPLVPRRPRGGRARARSVLPGAGHLPWVEDPQGFGEEVRTVL
ncbi:hypothetical protein [Streptomyces sp. CRN 30]|uniref:hypothetical protein n=1 Tax=Streptomyces sp. CRN 30 TaxID=3075613 RepID=UPI002A80659E|nr:hypothetical protein [Streptomyces sp. CRN 30]